MTLKKVIPVILCGGFGTRLWPLSRKSFPKQFLSINKKENKSLLQKTQERINQLDHIKEFNSLIDMFFDNVLVNDENIEIKNNRINLLTKKNQNYCQTIKRR